MILLDYLQRLKLELVLPVLALSWVLLRLLYLNVEKNELDLNLRIGNMRIAVFHVEEKRNQDRERDQEEHRVPQEKGGIDPRSA